MQQTEHYQFNLIEADDDFSPNPLNENMEKVEQQLQSAAAALAQQAASLGTGGKTCRMAFGVYQGAGTSGSGSPLTLQVDFVPTAVIMGRITAPSAMYWPVILLRPAAAGTSDFGGSMTVAWEDRRVKLYADNAGNQENDASYSYAYLVLGYSE